MITTKHCKQCGRSFPGGPRAWYCPDCRYERRLERGRERKKHGAKRPIGSVDMCVICGNEYVVRGGNQKYCPECAKGAVAAIDRRQGLAYYRANKDTINPKRNENRRMPPVEREVCGKIFKTHTRAKTCSPECRRIRRNEMWMERYYPRAKKKGRNP